MATAHREQSFGVSQLDYVRRLADRIANDIAGSDRPVVIGILGSDVYDKLLILQALRERLPRATFFTTDLDARLTDPDVFVWTRNLIVGSAYGFTVMGLEGAGFRDSYQTALYRAVTLALNKKYEERVPYPRLFEIGRSGAVDITDHRNIFTKNAYEKIHGRIRYFGSKITFWPQVGAVLFVLAPLFALTIYALLRRSVLHYQRLSSRRKAHNWVAAIGAVSIISLGFLVWHLKSKGNEPWVFFEGVSSVPTLVLQLTTIVFAYGILHIALGRINQAHSDIQDNLGLPLSSGDSKWKFRDLRALFRRQKWHTLPCIHNWKHDLSGVNQTRKKAADCWNTYLKYSGWRARVARISIPFLISALVTVYVFCPYVFSPFPRARTAADSRPVLVRRLRAHVRDPLRSYHGALLH